MNPAVTPDLKEVIEAVHYRPAVSVILPIETKINMKEELEHSLKIAADKVEKELSQNYPDSLASEVSEKLRNIIKNIEFDKEKKSIAIYVSPVFEKVFYLDIVVDEKIIVSESFEIRDLIYSKKQLHKYLVLLLSGQEYKIFMGDGNELASIKLNIPQSLYAYINEVPERVANFSDMQDRKEIVTDKFLHHIDDTLDHILNTYPIPVFVLGAEKLLGHFKSVSKHTKSVVEYIHGNYEEATLPELKKILEPHIAALKKVKQDDLLKRLDEAAGKKKIAVGIKEVWKQAASNKGQLLIVEKNYTYAAEHGSSREKIYKAVEPINKFSHITDAVDDVIEMVLANGGDVEFVDEAVLNEYNHIALVQYY